MITISLCMIVKNEEDVIGRCLASARDIADEIIIADTGSTDRTKAIARQMGASVFDFEWTDDFSAARNASFEKATMDYILWLDADDVIDEENRKAFLALKETLDPRINSVMMRYHIAFDGAGKPTYTFFRERLVRRAAGFRWVGRVHEVIITSGQSIHSDIAIRHEKLRRGEPGRNLRIYERMVQEGEQMDPRQLYYYARELSDNGRTSEAVPLFRQTIENNTAWIENRLGACRDLSGCLQRLGDPQGAMQALCEGFSLDSPRAEICCDMGHLWMERKNYKAAIFWYQAALQCVSSEASGGFGLPECRGYIPYLQLCVCYDRIGEYVQAEAFNDKAEACKPESKACALNKEYFKKRREKKAGTS